MRKVIKISVKLLSAIILLLIILPLMLSLLLSLESVQNFAADAAARAVSRKIGTTVSIGRVDVRIFNRIHIERFYVEDYSHDTLLYVDRLDCRPRYISLIGGGLSLGSGHLSGVKFYLRETPDGVMNIKQVVDSISRRDRERKGNFKLSVGLLEADSLDMRIERLEHRNPEYGIDFGDMAILDTRMRLRDFSIKGPVIETRVESFSAREQSGFVLDTLSGDVLVDRGIIRINNGMLTTARSRIGIESLSLEAPEWPTYKYFIDSVQMEGRFAGTTLSSDDVAYFSPKLRGRGITLTETSGTVSGTVADMKVGSLSLRSGGATLSLAGSAKGLPDIRRTRFDAEIKHLHAGAADIRRLSEAFGAQLPQNVTDIASRAGGVSVSGTFRGTFASFASRASLSSPAGRADINLRIRPSSGGGRNIAGSVISRNIDAGRLLASQHIGLASLALNIEGDTGADADAAMRGRIDRLQFNGYDIDSIRLDGRVTGRKFDGRIYSEDRALQFDFNGSVEAGDDIPRYDFCLDLDHADLALLGINRRDSISLLSCHVDAEGSGRTPDDLNGRIEINDARYIYDSDTLRSQSILLEGRNSERDKLLRLTSDLADASFVSRKGYKEIFTYLHNCLRSYIPSYFDDNDDSAGYTADATASPDEFSILTVELKEFNRVADAISHGLQIADGSRMNMMFNPSSGLFSIHAESDYVERNRMLATEISFTASNTGDSLMMYARSADLYAGAFYASQPVMLCGAKNDAFNATVNFSDSLREVSGMLGLQAEITRSPSTGRKIDLRILPSHLTRRDRTWRITARKIEIDTAAVTVERFRMMNDRQELAVDGIASRSANDSITLTLRDFDLAPFAQLADRMGYSIEGKTNGFATAKSALHGAVITARILMDSIKVNDIPSPALILDSRWDFERSRAHFFMNRRIDGDTLVRGYYDPSRSRYYARMDVDSMDMALLDPVLKGVISGTEGRARLEMTLNGEGRTASLRGQVRVKGLKTRVDYTQVAYSAPEAVLDIDNNRFSASGVSLFDEEGNRGTLDFDMSLQHLSNISYSLTVRPEKMLVLNTTERDNSYFYGRIHATGSAMVRGDKRGVNMNIIASTDDGSEFYMPLSNKSDIARADFVIFESADRPDTSNYLVRKRMMFERKRREHTGGEGNLDINLALDVRRNTGVQLIIDPAAGDVLKGNGEGMFNLHINPRNNIFEMFGDYTITEGSYRFTLMDIVSKPFTIESGSTIVWTGEPLDALLNIDAVYSTKTSLAPLTEDFANDRATPVECVIHISDRLTSPLVTFDIRVPSADSELQTLLANILNTQESIARQVMYLLVLNSFISDTGTSSGIGASASAATGLAMLTNQVSNILSGDAYKINFRYRPASGTTGTGDEVDLGFSKSLVNDRLLIEAEGNYVIDNRSATDARRISNFMGNAYITWLIDRAGTLRLKGFTQTIDRFDENQGLQETGIGIYYKEDFDNFKDLRRRIRERFMGRKKRERLTAEADSLARAIQSSAANESVTGYIGTEEIPAGEN
ncbi:MAG: translocation/assembly module TamB domain-containing protein [Alistipes sp.]|nr:translocation/assembly module TamB domain-containing protein [Alistipes sp.]